MTLQRVSSQGKGKSPHKKKLPSPAAYSGTIDSESGAERPSFFLNQKSYNLS